ncbi:hypothetical protein M422DRAFT_48485 [Sphaerobolus stellatus SS14]|uniref:Uncharacterized protein n=1 Tax=Sphaerobolus stellatus (strain SS14) TaxID=990650 RepID=A0A0C9UFK8_SPHS4|nr:hypothetical protein M422DRAFT_48485 [Sphaerobolus stellatus SS14]
MTSFQTLTKLPYIPRQLNVTFTVAGRLFKGDRQVVGHTGIVTQKWMVKEKEKDPGGAKEKEKIMEPKESTHRELTEVIAQGIELRCRWIREIKIKVEEECSLRLAKHDVLATGC